MNEKSRHQPASSGQPNFCAICAHPVPKLTFRQRVSHRFCGNCASPIQWGDNEWLPVTLDEATGTIVHGERAQQRDLGRVTIRERFDSLLQNPGKVFAAGAGAVAVGGGLIFTAAPLAALGAVISAAGVTIVTTAVVGGVVMAIIASNVDDEETVGLILKSLCAVAIAGLATVVLGGLIGFLAALIPLLGGILITAGALASAAVVGHQIHLRQQKQRLERASLVGTSKTECAGNLPSESAGDVGQLLSDFLNHYLTGPQAMPKPKTNPGLN